MLPFKIKESINQPLLQSMPSTQKRFYVVNPTTTDMNTSCSNSQTTVCQTVVAFTAQQSDYLHSKQHENVSIGLK